jgi:hypothetical protein
MSINQEEPWVLTRIYPTNFFLLSFSRNREDPSLDENLKDLALMENSHSIAATLGPKRCTSRTYIIFGDGKIWVWFEKI